MKQAQLKVGECAFLQVFKGGGGGLQVAFFGFGYEWIDNICLALLLQFAAQKLQCAVAVLCRSPSGAYRDATGRQGVDDGDIQIAVQG